MCQYGTALRSPTLSSVHPNGLVWIDPAWYRLISCPET